MTIRDALSEAERELIAEASRALRLGPVLAAAVIANHRRDPEALAAVEAIGGDVRAYVAAWARLIRTGQARGRVALTRAPSLQGGGISLDIDGMKGLFGRARGG